MSMMIAMDLQAALIAHLHWKSKLSDFFYGLEDLRIADVADHTNTKKIASGGDWLSLWRNYAIVRIYRSCPEFSGKIKN